MDTKGNCDQRERDGENLNSSLPLTGGNGVVWRGTKSVNAIIEQQLMLTLLYLLFLIGPSSIVVCIWGCIPGHFIEYWVREGLKKKCLTRDIVRTSYYPHPHPPPLFLLLISCFWIIRSLLSQNSKLDLVLKHSLTMKTRWGTVPYINMTCTRHQQIYRVS